MSTKIAWAITGSGCWLFESFEIIGKLLRNPEVSLDLFFSESGREVAQCYGIFKSPVPQNIPYIDRVREIPNFNEDIFLPNFVEKYQWIGVEENNKEEKKQATTKLKTTDKNKKKIEDFDYDEAFHDVIFECDEGASYPTAASASNNRYDFIVISPASGNTVSKIASGIADNLITNLAIMGSKSSKTEIIVIPTDYKEGTSRSYLPIMLHSDVCAKCNECAALWTCKPGAIRRKRGKIRINRLKCIGCLDCVRFCRYGVISFLEEITVNVRKREAEMAQKIASFKNFLVFETPDKGYKYLQKKYNL
jgi:dihydromethanopterin reductase (acceptor)